MKNGRPAADKSQCYLTVFSQLDKSHSLSCSSCHRVPS